MQNGYKVHGSGKIYHGRYPDPKSWQDYLRKGSDPKPSPEILKSPRSKSGGIVFGVLDVKNEAMDDHKMVNYAIDFLKEEHNKPFFLACGIFKPHMPWQVPRKYYDMYPPEKIQLPKTLDTDLDDVPLGGKRMARPDGDHATMLKTGNWRYAVQAYLASITFADAQVGRLLKGLDASPHADNTIIVLWGDHGWHLGEKHHWRKFALWEEATRAPLMMTVPGLTKANSRCGRTVDFMNIYPTLCELCDLPQPDHLEGVSMTSLLKNPQTEWSRPAITTYNRGNHAIRSERYRYIRYADGGEELYDHETDPLEWKNLAGNPKLANVKAALGKWLSKKNAPNSPSEVQKNKKRKKG
jgi:arylsulfatase A-like enzyme